MSYSICLELGNEKNCIGWIVARRSASGVEAAASGVVGSKASELGAVDAILAKCVPSVEYIEGDVQLVPLFLLYDHFHGVGVLPKRPDPAHAQGVAQHKKFRKKLLALAQDDDCYRLRREGLERPLHPWELFLAVLHVVHRRGRDFFRKSRPGQYEETMEKLSALLSCFECRTLGEAMSMSSGEARAAIGQIVSHAFIPRGIVIREIDALLRKQRALGSPYCDEAFYRACLSLLAEREGRPASAKSP